MLNAAQVALYQRLQKFELDNPSHEFGFTRHLVKNHGWTESYAQRVITEYKKFAFLTVEADHQVVPSDQVDQVWHAHVLLTQPYWEEFCPKVLQQPLHHHPARGGRTERDAFHQLYRQTIASYRRFFGAPPTDIWSPPDIRFGKELKMQRVSRSDYWMIPKRLPQWHIPQPWAVILLVVWTIIGWVEVAHSSTTGQMQNSLPIYQQFHVICGLLLLGLIIRYIIRSPSQQAQRPQLDVYETAYLAGKESRVVDLAITRLVDQGHLRPNIRHRTFSIEKPLPPEATALEHQLMNRVVSQPEFKHLRQTRNYTINFLKERLERENLLMKGWSAFMGYSFGAWIGLMFLIPLLLNIVFTIFDIQPAQLTVVDVLWGTVGYTTGVVTLCCLTPSQRTRWGSHVLADIKNGHDTCDMMQRFALHGYQTLSGGALDDLKRIFQKQAEDDAGGCGCGC